MVIWSKPYALVFIRVNIFINSMLKFLDRIDGWDEVEL